ncbi:hypothetical protein B7P43_G06106, partial [Cryptotermes secundus]
SDTGGWGAWSPWTHCTSSCGGGTRSRFRLCDSPAPRYGARFCEGPSLQSESCRDGTESWGCLLSPSSSLPVDHPGVVAEVGPGCRCGCVVHLSVAKPRRILATSTASCPGRTFWLIQADAGSVIRLTVVHLRLPCGRQWLKVRDGDSLAATLVAYLSGRVTSHAFTSTSNYLLLDFFSDDVVPACLGSFLALAEQTAPLPRNMTLSLEEVAVLSANSPALSMVHLLAAVFVAVVLLVSALLAAQSLFRYQKYQLAMSRDSELGSAPSCSTLLSEVISIKRLRPGCATVHTRLCDEEERDEGLDSEPVVREDVRSQRQHLGATPSSAVSWSSVATLSNGWGSPNSRQKNSAKERKEKCNLERLLASGCSELSLAAGDTDLELDYYDYNVSNAGAVPGSFLGMDPQYLVWIPPFAPGRWEVDGELLEMGARSQHQSGSDSDELTEFIPKAQNGHQSDRWQHQPVSDMDDVTEFIPKVQQKVNNRYTKPVTRLQHQKSETEGTMEFIPLICRGQDSGRKEKLRNNRYSEKDVGLTARSQHRPEEKETQVEKSPYEDDIKFVDDEDDDEDEKQERGSIILTDNKQRHSMKNK